MPILVTVGTRELKIAIFVDKTDGHGDKGQNCNKNTIVHPHPTDAICKIGKESV